MNTDLHFSRQTCNWATPDGLFRDLDKEFGFTLDVCASSENAMCEKYYTAEDDGLLQKWFGVCWCNPPYGNAIADWVAKARMESVNMATVVCLLPARTDTRWFHEHVLGRAEIRFIKGRLKFGDAKHSAPFPSMIVIFKTRTHDTTRIFTKHHR